MSRRRCRNTEKLCEVSFLVCLCRRIVNADEKGRGPDNAITLRTVATSLSRLVAGLALPPTSYDSVRSAEEMAIGMNQSEVAQSARRAMEWRVQNELGALSWREGDDRKLALILINSQQDNFLMRDHREHTDALSLSKAVQASAEALASVADSVHGTVRLLSRLPSGYG